MSGFWQPWIIPIVGEAQIAAGQHRHALQKDAAKFAKLTDMFAAGPSAKWAMGAEKLYWALLLLADRMLKAGRALRVH